MPRILHFLRREKTMKCKHCGADNSNESKFCFQCGQELSPDDVQQPEDPPVDPTHPICKNCGASNTIDAKFCHQCGQELSSEAEDPEQKSDDDLPLKIMRFRTEACPTGRAVGSPPTPLRWTERWTMPLQRWQRKAR